MDILLDSKDIKHALMHDNNAYQLQPSPLGREHKRAWVLCL